MWAGLFGAGRLLARTQRLVVHDFDSSTRRAGFSAGLIAQCQIVKIVGWDSGADKVRAITSIRESGEIALSRAKAMIESALLDSEALFTTRTVYHAEQVVEQLKEHGFHSVQLWSKQR